MHMSYHIQHHTANLKSKDQDLCLDLLKMPGSPNGHGPGSSLRNCAIILISIYILSILLRWKGLATVVIMPAKGSTTSSGLGCSPAHFQVLAGASNLQTQKLKLLESEPTSYIYLTYTPALKFSHI